jgi:hypothetical protein
LSSTFVYRDINHVLGTGQSLSIGYAGTPPLSTKQPYANVMFSSGVLAGGEPPPNLVPLVEGNPREAAAGVETMSSGFANSVAKWAREQMLVHQPVGQTSHDLLVSVDGVAGYAYSGLKKGTPPYNGGIAQVKAGLAAAQAAGKSYVVRAVTNVHGETDHVVGNTEYEQNLFQWQSDYETDIKAITGQTDSVPMIISQISFWTARGDATSFIPGLQLAAHLTSNGKIVLVGPKYHLEHQHDGHLTNHGYQQMGEDYAKVYRRIILEGKPWEPLRPIGVTRNGSVVRIKFLVPVPPLVLDEKTVTNPGAYGFEYTDDSGAPPWITSVTVSAPDEVTLTLSARPKGGSQRVRYAFTGIPGAPPGPKTGARGNLRDSDSSPSPNGNPHFSWCIVFDEPVP